MSGSRLIATAIAVTVLAHAASADVWQAHNTIIHPDAVVGSGEGRALLVLDPNLSDLVADTAFVEYRWDVASQATVDLEDVLNDIAAVSGRLALEWHPRFDSDAEGWATFGIGFDVDGDGLNYTPGVPQDAPGGFPGSEDGASNDPDDWYFEGWFTNGFWSQWISGDGESWAAAFGIATVDVADGQWHGLSWAPGFASSEPTVPEPTSLAWIGLGALALVRRRHPAVCRPARPEAAARPPRAAHAVLGAAALLLAASQGLAAAADQVVAFDPGTETVRANSAAALGTPDGITGENSGFGGNVLSPFSPAFESDEIVRMRGQGAGITLRLSNFAIDVPGPDIGVIANVGLIDTAFPNGQAGDPVSTFAAPRQAMVEVSENGADFVSLGTVVFENPADYFVDVTNPYQSTPGSVPADFGKPFTGSLSDFSGLNYGEMKTLLDGSIGGTWLDIGGSGLSRVGYVRFTTVAANGYDFVLDSVLVADDATGGAVPEPGSITLLLAGGGCIVAARRRHRT